MKKDKIKNQKKDVTFLGEKLYNPNSYTAIDASICFIVAIIVFFILDKSCGKLFLFLKESGYVTDYYILNIFSVLISQSSVLLIVVIFSKVRHVGFLSGGGYKFKFEWIDVLFAMLLIIGVSCVFSSLHYQFVDDFFVSRYGMTFEEYEAILSGTVELNDKYYLFYFLYIFVLVPLLPAIIEEAMFRGVILRGYGSLGAICSILLTSLMFMLMHGSFEQMILQFIGGLAITAVVYLSKNFALGCVMHFTNNLFVVLIAVFQETGNEIINNGYYIYDLLSISFGIIFLVVSIIYFGKKFFVAYKNKLIGKQSKCYDKLQFAKIVDNQGNQFYLERNKIDYDKLKSTDSKFIYNGKITSINKFKSLKIEIILIAIGIFSAVASIILAII